MTTLNESLLHKEFEPTGPIELMDFEQIDIAVVNRIGEIVSRIATPRLKGWAAKPLDERVMLGEFESPRRFLMAMTKDGVTKAQLPAIYVTREPGITFADPSTSAAIDLDEVNTIYDEDEQLVALLDASVLTFNYTVNFVGWNDRDIEPLAALYCMFLKRRSAEKKIDINTLIAEAQITVSGKFTDGPLVSAVNASLPYDDGKLRCLAVTAAFDVDYLQARYATERTVETQFSLEVLGAG